MLRRRRGSVSTPRSGPSLFGLLVLGSPRPGGQPKSQKAFWAACLDLGSFRRAAPRAVGSRRRVGLLARPSAAVASAGARASRAFRSFHPPHQRRRSHTAPFALFRTSKLFDGCNFLFEDNAHFASSFRGPRPT